MTRKENRALKNYDVKKGNYLMRKFGFLGILMVIIVLLNCSKTEAKEWRTDFKKASADAKTSDKYILLDFSGSDWCGWCQRLEKEVL